MQRREIKEQQKIVYEEKKNHSIQKQKESLLLRCTNAGMNASTIGSLKKYVL